MTHIQETLKKHNISFAEYAKITGLDRTLLYKHIKYTYKPKIETIIIYAKGLAKITGNTWKFHRKQIEKEL